MFVPDSQGLRGNASIYGGLQQGAFERQDYRTIACSAFGEDAHGCPGCELLCQFGNVRADLMRLPPRYENRAQALGEPAECRPLTNVLFRNEHGVEMCLNDQYVQPGRVIGKEQERRTRLRSRTGNLDGNAEEPKCFR